MLGCTPPFDELPGRQLMLQECFSCYRASTGLRIFRTQRYSKAMEEPTWAEPPLVLPTYMSASAAQSRLCLLQTRGFLQRSQVQGRTYHGLKSKVGRIMVKATALGSTSISATRSRSLWGWGEGVY
jgi:hypothetical protein